jgi:hypothetical protein
VNVDRVEPERELIRRVAPFGPPAAALALLIGWLIGGWSVGWSAAIGVAVVLLNFLASGLSIAWAARISPTVMAAVVAGGFVVRLGTIAGIIALLNQLAWFSTVAFVATVMPATIVLLIFEMKVMSGRMLQANLWATGGNR